jgi:crotonobetainyl-CoA:carnitine CoA-transferase CaiB-like acyl-CoA transferase
MDPWLDRDAIKQRLDAATPTRATDDWLQAMLAAGLWAAPVRTMKQAMDELITDESDLVVEVEHAGGRTLRLLGCPITLSETPWRQRLRPPTVGEHTHDILAAVLDDAELTALQRAGAL